MRKLVVIFFLICVNFSATAKNVRIGLFKTKTLKQVDIQYHIGRYAFFSEDKMYFVLSNSKEKIRFKASGNKVTAYRNNEKISKQIWFRLDEKTSKNSLRIIAGKTVRKYKGNMIVFAVNGKLKIVNEVNIDDYVEGVIKAEAGYGYSLEYYKVQAVISRTYVLYKPKHKREGYDLCDHTHCQVYKGINYKKTIHQAVQETSGEVIVDSNLNYINTLFSSNCGGQTVTTDYVWLKKTPCIESIKDTFCLKSSQATWRKTISKKIWIHYLANKTGRTESYIKSQKLNFNQYSRKKFLKIGSKKVKLTHIRKYFRLKSTYFSVHDIGGKIVLIGKGFGHGAGLCQEGGIVMSKTHNYKEVLYFYYKNISILSIEKLKYFRMF